MTNETLAAAFRQQSSEKRDTVTYPLFEVYEEISSTSDRLLELAREGAPEGMTVLADRQTAGRGRRGRRWESPGGANLAMSLLLRPALPAGRLSEVTLLAAEAVRRAILQKAGLSAQIKWPNDLLLNGKKCCGILTELYFGTDGKPFLLLGIGVNVRRAEKSAEVEALSVSLEEAGGRCSRSELAAGIFREFFLLEEKWQKEEDLSFLRESYASSMAWRGEEVRLFDAAGEYASGTAEGIGPHGELLLKKDGNVAACRSGELSLRPVY